MTPTIPDCSDLEPFYASIDRASNPADYADYPWESINYIANNYDPDTWEYNQRAVWWVMSQAMSTPTT